MNLKSLTVICLFLTAGVFILTPAFAGGSADKDETGWPRLRGPNGNGVSMETDWDPEALDKGPKLLWSADIGIGHSNVAIMDDRLYTMGFGKGETSALCLDSNTGEEKWRTGLETSDEVNSTPTIDGSSLYCLNLKGVLFCLNTRNGKIRWKQDLVKDLKTDNIPYGFNTSPLVVDDLLILNINTAGLALNKKTGKVVWASEAHEKLSRVNGQGYHATPVLYDYQSEKRLLLFGATGLLTLEPSTGQRLSYYEWYEPNTATCADPEPFDDKVFLRGNNILNSSLLLDISGNEPKPLWENQSMCNDVGTCVRMDRYIYGSDGFQRRLFLRCIDFFTGELMWEQEMHLGGNVAVSAAGDKLLVLEDDGNLHIAEASPEAYTEISSCQLPSTIMGNHKWWTPPVLYRNRIYCRNYTGDLVCIDMSK